MRMTAKLANFLLTAKSSFEKGQTLFRSGNSSSKLSKGLYSTATALTTVGLMLDKTTTAGRITSGVFTGIGGSL